jgi:hypothetical protein
MQMGWGPAGSENYRKNTTAFRDYMSNYIGVDVAFPKILGGDKAELTPKPKIGVVGDPYQNYSKLTYEIRRLGKDLLGIFTIEFKKQSFRRIFKPSHAAGIGFRITDSKTD